MTDTDLAALVAAADEALDMHVPARRHGTEHLVHGARLCPCDAETLARGVKDLAEETAGLRLLLKSTLTPLEQFAAADPMALVRTWRGSTIATPSRCRIPSTNEATLTLWPGRKR